VFNDPEMQELLEFVNIDSKRVQEAINLADIDGDDGVTKVEFSEALESMHLEVRKSDIRHVLQKIAIAGRKSQENHTRLAEQVDSIERSQKASALECCNIDSRLSRIEQLLLQATGQQPATQIVDSPRNAARAKLPCLKRLEQEVPQESGSTTDVGGLTDRMIEEELSGFRDSSQ